MWFRELQSKVCKKESHESFLVDLEHKGPVLDSGDLVVWEVEAVQGLVELEAVSDGGHPGVEDSEAGDVRVQGDREVDEAGVGARHT